MKYYGQFLGALVLFFALSNVLYAKVFLDYEADPIPLINIHILIPSKRLLASDRENLALSILSECYDHGTERLNKQQFQDALAKYGLSLGMNPGFKYLSIDLSFPLKDSKIPDGVFALVKEALDSPRIDTDTFDKSKKLLRASLLSSVDRDGSVMAGSMQRYVAVKMFDLKPSTIETFDTVTIDDVKNMHQNFYQTDGDAWVGIVGPEQLKTELANFAQKLIPTFGDVDTGMLKTRLATGYMPTQKSKLPPTFILVDKADRAQIYYAMLLLGDDKITPKTELVHDFTDSVLSGGSMNSLFVRRIRVERGIAYQVSGLMSDFYDHPVYSVFANPQRNRQSEAFEVLAQLMKDTFQTTSIIKALPANDWKSRLMAYQNSERQGGVTPDGRLGRRKAVATGDLSYEYYNTPVEELIVSQKQSEKDLQAIYAESSLVYGAIGDAKEIQPLIEKNFPGVKIIKIPYKETISNKWLQ